MLILRTSVLQMRMDKDKFKSMIGTPSPCGHSLFEVTPKVWTKNFDSIWVSNMTTMHYFIICIY